MGFDMTLASLGFCASLDFDAAKIILLRDADDAFRGGNKDLCLDAIQKLYDLYDAEFEAA